MSKRAEIVAELGPWDGVTRVHGVSFDGRHVWFATEGRLVAIDPETGREVRRVEAEADAGTAFDGKHLWQLTGDRIQQLDPASGEVLRTIPAPAEDGSGLAWHDGKLWVGGYREKAIHRVDPETGAVEKTLRSDRFVTGVTFAGEALWHGTLEDGRSELRRIDVESGAILERLELPEGKLVSGLEHDGNGNFFCGGASTGRVRAVRAPS